jgi:small subunit ribosomal protein S15
MAKMITKDTKAKVVANVQRHKNDVGSPEAQVAILTQRINEVNEHLKANKHDNHGRRGLMQMVGHRKRLLKYLQEKNYEAYQGLIAKLGLRK